MAFTKVTSGLLNDTGVTAGVYGGSSAIPSITINSQGQITLATNNAISIVSVAQANGAIITNSTSITASYTFPAGTNGQSVGPIAIAPTYSVTIAPGQRWVIV